LKAAASVAHRSVNEFVLESALARADEALADRRIFSLNATQWKVFVAALDAPPRPLPRLNRDLLRYAWTNQQAGTAPGCQSWMQRTLQAADIAGIRAFAVHAKDEEARRFYQKFDFIPSPTDPMHLFVLLKDVRRIVSER
jgi:uncharacterized protein (DUF1778 family)